MTETLSLGYMRVLVLEEVLCGRVWIYPHHRYMLVLG